MILQNLDAMCKIDYCKNTKHKVCNIIFFHLGTLFIIKKDKEVSREEKNNCCNFTKFCYRLH